jgi:hypothetical protein
MMAVNIRVLGVVTHPLFNDVLWLQSYDPTADGGIGEAVMTMDRTRAMVLPDAKAAMEIYLAVPANHPVRLTDGKPNRPLTAYTIEVLGTDEQPINVSTLNSNLEIFENSSNRSK